jgi:hypothetical protein
MPVKIFCAKRDCVVCARMCIMRFCRNHQTTHICSRAANELGISNAKTLLLSMLYWQSHNYHRFPLTLQGHVVLQPSSLLNSGVMYSKPAYWGGGGVRSSFEFAFGGNMLLFKFLEVYTCTSCYRGVRKCRLVQRLRHKLNDRLIRFRLQAASQFLPTPGRLDERSASTSLRKRYTVLCSGVQAAGTWI